MYHLLLAMDIPLEHNHLHKTFLDFGILPEQVEEAVRVFRSRYTTIGKFENFPYPGIPELLAELKQQGHTLYVATSKPEETAIEILEKFELSQYFTLICGASIALNRMEKAEVIELLLQQVGTLENTIMVGDTAFDVTGAAQHGISTIGVSWGYGKVQDMVDAGAIAIADTTQQLLELLQA